MNIPLDRLYDYIETVAKEVSNDVIIYRFYPHGSKNHENLFSTKPCSWYTEMVSPRVVCHDQEPLNYEHSCSLKRNLGPWEQMLVKYNCYQASLTWANIFDKQILLHSEKRSKNVDQFQNDIYLPVYYWSHAIIALDWFRYAKCIDQEKNSKQTFLIYNRAWSGTREYRLKFLDLLVDHNLTEFCKTTVNSQDPELLIHYDHYKFKNSQWKPCNILEKYFIENDVPATYSADFDLADYEATDIEVVLETLFDDDRLHLTEKSLRPIACGQPFILASTVGGLDYLRSYGFKTFDSVWDEGYDLIVDPVERLHAICKLMKDISCWDPKTKKIKLAQAQKIARYNKKWFFSKKFFNLVNSELIKNLQNSLNTLLITNTSCQFIEQRKQIAKFPELKQVMIGRVANPNLEKVKNRPYADTFMATSYVVKVLQRARFYYQQHTKNQHTQD